MTNEKMWGQDLTLVPGFEQAAAENLRRIRTEGARAGFRRVPGPSRSVKEEARYAAMHPHPPGRQRSRRAVPHPRRDAALP